MLRHARKVLSTRPDRQSMKLTWSNEDDPFTSAFTSVRLEGTPPPHSLH